MVDFRKLLEEARTQSPEERATRARERDREFQLQIEQQLNERIECVRAASGLVRDAREIEFVKDLLRFASQDHPNTGLVGGKLLSLTDSQLEWLRRIAMRAQENPSKPRSRAERYR